MKGRERRGKEGEKEEKEEKRKRGGNARHVLYMLGG